MSGNKLNIDLSNTQTFKTLVAGEATLQEAYVLSVQADATESRIQGAKACVFDVLRYHMVDIYRRALTAVNDDVEKLDRDAVIGRFLNLVEDAKAGCVLPAGHKDKTYGQYVSDLKGAVEAGVNLAEHAQSGRNKINQVAKELRDAAANAADAARKAATAGEGNGNGAIDTDPDGKAPVDNKGNNGSQASDKPADDAGEKAKDTPHQHMSDEEFAAAVELVKMLDVIKGANPDKFEKMMTNIGSQVRGAHSAIIAKMTLAGNKKAANG